MTTVLDASAVLAYLRGEPGAVEVEAALVEGAVIVAANWSEICQKVSDAGGSWNEARALLQSYAVEIVHVSATDAELAAQLWRRGSGLSLADRLCLALGARLNAVVVTADSAWGDRPGTRQIR